eukprot:UN17983
MILTHFVCKSKSFKASETWTPICLPQFTDKGFLHAYITYLKEECCVVFVTADESQKSFHR